MSETVGRILTVEFDNGEIKQFDALPYITNGPVFKPLENYSEFCDVWVHEYGRGIEWKCGADLSRDTLYIVGV